MIPEETKVAPPHSLSQLVVCLQRLAQPRLGEVLVLRDLSQQQAYQDEPLADHHSEAKGAVGSLKCTNTLIMPSKDLLFGVSYKGLKDGAKNGSKAVTRGLKQGSNGVKRGSNLLQGSGIGIACKILHRIWQASTRRQEYSLKRGMELMT